MHVPPSFLSPCPFTAQSETAFGTAGSPCAVAGYPARDEIGPIGP
jgi:hypothetical protein